MSDWVKVALGDIETTGISQEAGHRIIEVALDFYGFNKATGEVRSLGEPFIRRCNPERLIDPGAEAVHHISLSMLRGAPKWEVLGPTVGKLLSKVDLFVAHNAAFDAPFLALELLRIGEPMPSFNVYCTMENGRKATAMGKVPNLGELAYAMGVDYDSKKAHSALYDTQVLSKCYWKGVETGMYALPNEA